MIVDAVKNKANFIGRLGENEARTLRFNIRETLKEYPEATHALLFRAPKSPDAYVVPSEQITTDLFFLYWEIKSSDLRNTGTGSCELIATQGTKIIKDDIYTTFTDTALDGSGEAPEPWESWQQEFKELEESAKESASAASQSAVTAVNAAEDSEAYAVGTRDGEPVPSDDPAYENNSKYYATQARDSAGTASQKASEAAGSASDALGYKNDALGAKTAAETAQGKAEDAQEAAEAAITHYPRVSDVNGNWEVWNPSTSQYEDTGVHAQGEQGEQGEKGDSVLAGTLISGDDYILESEVSE